MAEKEMFLKSAGFKIRVGLSIVIWAGWLCFLVLYVFLLANSWGHSLLEGVGVILVSFIIVVVLTVLLWVFWGLNFAAKHEELIEKGLDKGIESYIDKRIEEKLKGK